MPPSAIGFAPLPAIDRASTIPLYRQIYESYRRAILEGRLAPGERLPSTRLLSTELGVSRLPVLHAFDLLFAEGYCEGRTGSGTFVSTDLPLRPSRSTAARHPERRRALAPRAASLVRPAAPWLTGSGAFRVGDAAFARFPLAIWKRLLARQARGLTAEALRYSDPLGYLPLREAIATYLGAVRGVRADAARILVTSGSQQALAIAVRALLEPGETAWVEEPGYWGVRELLRSEGIQHAPVPVDDSGMDIGRALRVAPEARAAFVTPSHQFPLGATLSASRRLELLAWAERRAGWIVEDDYDSEYRYDSQPVATLQALDENRRVIYIGTFSKVLFGALRLGFLVLPADLVPVFAAVRRSIDISPATFPQAVLAEFIRQGHFARHLRRMRRLYRERRDALVEALSERLDPAVTIRGGGAGLHLVVELPRSVDEEQVVARAAAAQLWTMPLSFCRYRASGPPGLVLGFGGVEARDMRREVGRLADLLASP